MQEDLSAGRAVKRGVVAVARRGELYLAIRRGRAVAAGGRVCFPGGHIEPGEEEHEAVVRECLEETACEFVPLALLGVYLSRFVRESSEGRPAEDVTYLRIAYAGRVGLPDAGRALDTGIVRRLWLTPDEVRASAARHRSPLVLRCIEDHLAGRRYPLEAVGADASVYAPRSIS